MNRGNTGWMNNGGGAESSLGQLSNGNSPYKVKDMSPYERERRVLFEDFRSRIISQGALKLELDRLKLMHGVS